MLLYTLCLFVYKLLMSNVELKFDLFYVNKEEIKKQGDLTIWMWEEVLDGKNTENDKAKTTRHHHLCCHTFL